MTSKKAIVWFDEVGKGDVGLVDGKVTNLSVPYRFIVRA